MAPHLFLSRLIPCATAICLVLAATAQEPHSAGANLPPPPPLNPPQGVPIRDLEPVAGGRTGSASAAPAPSTAKPAAMQPAPPATVPVARPQAPASPASNRPPAPGDYDVPVDGFFPTQKMIERFLRHAATEIGRQLDADQEQVEYFREVLTNRVPQWLQRNRGPIKRLTNEYLEAILDEQPPQTAEVADWAERALPLFEQAQRLIDECAEDIRPSLGEDQLLELEAELAAMRVAGSFFRSKLELWQAGGYDPEVDWPDGAYNRQLDQAESVALQNAQRTAREQVLGAGGRSGAVAGSMLSAPRPAPVTQAPADAMSLFEDPWSNYVAEFVTRYDLNAEQAQTAYRYLHEAQRLRDRYQSRRLEEFRRIHAALRSEGEKDLAAIKADFDRLQAPIDNYFAQLQKRLDKLPTRAQRRAALERDQLQQPSSTVAEARG